MGSGHSTTDTHSLSGGVTLASQRRVRPTRVGALPDETSTAHFFGEAAACENAVREAKRARKVALEATQNAKRACQVVVRNESAARDAAASFVPTYQGQRDVRNLRRITPTPVP